MANSPPSEDHSEVIVIPDHAGEEERAVKAGTRPRRSGPDGGSGSDEEGSESVEQPAKVMRIGSMTKQLLEEVRHAPLDEASRARLKEIYETSVRELASGLSPDLAAELDRVAIPFDSATPSEAELRVAQAQLVGWLEGLFHGIQATLFAQQMAARAQLAEMHQRELPPGPPDENGPGLGTYL
ncbi:MAG: bacterial proteasome activator family protein [Acidimicrobiales bacterium]